MRSPVCSDLCCFLFRNDQTINDGWKTAAGLRFTLAAVTVVGYPAALLVFCLSVSVPLWHINWDEATFALHALWWWDSSHTKAEAFRKSPPPLGFFFFLYFMELQKDLKMHLFESLSTISLKCLALMLMCCQMSFLFYTECCLWFHAQLFFSCFFSL